MKNAPTTSTALALATLPEAQRLQLQARLRKSRADSTWDQYASSWRMFEAWCAERGIEALRADAGNVALYLDELASTRCAYSTVAGHRAAISAAFDTAGRDPSPTWDPLVRGVIKAIRRDLGVAAKHPKAAATADIMLRLLGAINVVKPTTEAARRGPRASAISIARDRALLLIGWMGAFRRAALVALTINDVKLETWGYAIRIRRDKNDPESKGRTVAIPRGNGGGLDAAAALEMWLKLYAARATQSSNLASTDALFPQLKAGRDGARFVSANATGSAIALSPASVATLVKRCAAIAKIDPAIALNLSAHSLRAGFVTTASLAGASDSWIQMQTGHASLDMIANYRRMVAPNIGNAASIVAALDRPTTTTVQP